MTDPHPDWCPDCGEGLINGKCLNRHYDDADDACCNPGGHEFVCSGTEYGGDDERYHGEGVCYCIWCGADGDA